MPQARNAKDAVPPNDVQAEKCVLGAILIDKTAVDRAAEILKPTDFYRNAHADIFAAMLELRAAGTVLDVVTIGAKLMERERLVAAGGRAYLIELTSEVATSHHLEDHAKIVALCSARRQAVDRARHLLAEVEESDEPAAAFQKAAAEMANPRGTKGRKAGTVREWMDETDYVEKLMAVKSRPMFTGSRGLDDILGGMHRGEMSFIAARPGVGKTTLALSIARFMIGNGFRPAFVTAEMSIQAILDRVLAMESKRPVRRFRSGQDPLLPDSAQVRDLTLGAGAMAELDMIVVNAHGMSPSGIRGALLPYRAAGKGPDIVFVDYVQLLASDGKDRETRNDELSTISRALNNLADEFDCHVCAMSQLSRDAAGGEPQLHHLRDSGSLEQDANQVIMAWKPIGGIVTAAERGTPVKVKVAKNRDGMTGSTSISIDFATYTILR